MKEEVWKDVVGYEAFYLVSNTGRIERKENTKTCASKELKPSKHSKGYYRVNLCDGNSVRCFLVHRLVAIAFIDNPKNKAQINHKNGVKTDNRVINLEWVDNSGNQIHAVKTGLKATKLTNEAIADIRANYIKRKRPQSLFAKKYNVSISCIGCVIRLKTWSDQHGNF